MLAVLCRRFDSSRQANESQANTGSPSTVRKIWSERAGRLMGIMYVIYYTCTNNVLFVFNHQA